MSAAARLAAEGRSSVEAVSAFTRSTL